MAKYDKRILVPYLRDICSLELLIAKLERENSEARTAIWQWKTDLDDPKPEEIQVTDGSGAGFFFGIACIAAIIATVLLIVGTRLGGFFGGVLKFAAFACFCISGLDMFVLATCAESSKDREEKIRKYQEELKAYEAREPKRARARAEVKAWEDYRDLTESRIEEVKQLREKAYSANIIPRQYRNIYAVHYLYEYMDTSQENDLDRVIQTFVLEEIKSRLDSIIEQQTEIILNQRCLIAKQEQSSKIMIENHKQKMQQLAMLNENSVNQTKYLQMINTNLAVSNYFAYHDYIRSR